MEITNIKPLYRYENSDNSITITLVQKNEGDPIHQYRIIADKDHELYLNGENKKINVLDVFSTKGWTQELKENNELNTDSIN